MSLILNLEDDDLDLFNKQYINLGELHSKIEKLLAEEEMTDGEPELHTEWKTKVNFLMNMYNGRSSFKKFDLL
jgi:hypothetical protein